MSSLCPLCGVFYKLSGKIYICELYSLQLCIRFTVGKQFIETRRGVAMVSKRTCYMFVVLLHSNVRSMLSHEGSLPHDGRIISTTAPSTSRMTMLGTPLLLVGEEVMYLLVVVGTGSARLGSALEVELSVVCSSSSS